MNQQECDIICSRQKARCTPACPTSRRPPCCTSGQVAMPAATSPNCALHGCSSARTESRGLGRCESTTRTASPARPLFRYGQNFLATFPSTARRRAR
eukprot:scaffold15652_cov68-Phaeocystis_antarctica.AAC.2